MTAKPLGFAEVAFCRRVANDWQGLQHYSAEVRSVVALDEGSAGLAVLRARVGGDDLRHQRTVAAGLDGLEGWRKPLLVMLL